MPQPQLFALDALSYFDVIVVGSGAAGLYAALCLPSHLRIALITKDAVNQGSSNWAQGGIAAAIAPSDTPEFHLTDTLQAGVGLCDGDAVTFLVEQAEGAIASLLDLGVAFDRHQGQLALTLEAAHSRPRVLHSADTTGQAIVSILAARVLEQPHIQIFEHSFALNVWLHPQTGQCQGIRLLSQGQVQWLAARAVVLATGGGGQVFAQTTNPAVSTGDGVAMAWRAGAIVRDLEFFQFHPTALTVPGAPRFLISEAVRGEGAHLVDETGDRFALHYHPSGELAPRDVVSRAIFSHLRSHDHAYLDLSPIAPQRLRLRFPNIIQTCHQWGIDVFNQPIPVAPAAHYWMGGIVTDLMSRTSIPGLYAIGECASTGVHGANRLASNSLLECLVFAAQLAKIELPSKRDIGSNDHKAKNGMTHGVTTDLTTDLMADSWPNSWPDSWLAATEKAIAIRQELPSLMWNHAGICRHQQELDSAIIRIQQWRSQLASTHLGQFILCSTQTSQSVLLSTELSNCVQSVAETLNLLDIGELILKSARWRTESRGGHYRNDYPQTHPDWQVHTFIRGNIIKNKAVALSSPAVSVNC
ncbi:MAG: L-aspartate oxidase [Cyanothece sp. SIO2G6]|nr:L-aspartate oxidase [Cyanothece sp. SIO2G6]